MKKYIMHFGLALIAMVMFSCNKESFDYKPGYAGISKITYYPSITLKGAIYLAVPKGGTFTDEGATATAGGKDIKIVTTGSVNTSTVGVYTINYTAINSDGFPAIGTRYVAVYSTDATAETNDFSGTYTRPANGYNAVWTKLAPGVYTVINPGGASINTLKVFLFNPTGNQIYIPQQNTSQGLTSSDKESSTPSSVQGTLSGYSMEIVNPGYGTSVRSFIKQ